MFKLRDHLPLDRIITRFSAPTTITQFQRSSLDGNLIELAWLVTHGVNDNIFCLSSLIESAGTRERGSADVSKQAIEKEKRTRWCIPVISSRLLFPPLHTFMFSNNTCHQDQQPGPSEPTDSLPVFPTQNQSSMQVPM